jgi:DNA-binding LacI/PurR family transcriptional regulator
LIIGFDNRFSRYLRFDLCIIAQDTMKTGFLMVSKLLDQGGECGRRPVPIPSDLIAAGPAAADNV